MCGALQLIRRTWLRRILEWWRRVVRRVRGFAAGQQTPRQNLAYHFAQLWERTFIPCHRSFQREEILKSVKSLMKGDCHAGCGCRQRGLQRGRFANPCKVGHYGRELAITLYSHDMETDVQLRSSLWVLSRLRLICHCAERQCHADKLMAAYAKDFPAAFDRSDMKASPPSSHQLNYLARLREEVESDDEGATRKGGG